MRDTSLLIHVLHKHINLWLYDMGITKWKFDIRWATNQWSIVFRERIVPCCFVENYTFASQDFAIFSSFLEHYNHISVHKEEKNRILNICYVWCLATKYFRCFLRTIIARENLLIPRRPRTHPVLKDWLAIMALMWRIHPHRFDGFRFVVHYLKSICSIHKKSIALHY